MDPRLTDPEGLEGGLFAMSLGVHRAARGGTTFEFVGIYQECGFPEIWVLVPWASSRRKRGLAIHVRGEDGYRDSPESMAFPGWKAEEIRLALTEEPLSGRAWRALERVALAMGEQEGKSPENDPLMRSVHRRAQSRGDTEGYARGRMEAVAAVLRTRGIEASRNLSTTLRHRRLGITEQAVLSQPRPAG